MPHFPVDPVVVGSVEAWRLIAKTQGESGLQSALSQSFQNAGYQYPAGTDFLKLEDWSFYSAVGDVYDQAHSLFGSTVYMVPNFGTTTPHLASILAPVEEDSGTPEEPPVPTAPVVPASEPEGYDLPDWIRGIQESLSGIRGAIGQVTESVIGVPMVKLAEDVDELILNWKYGQGSVPTGGNALTKGEENDVARVLGFVFRR